MQSSGIERRRAPRAAASFPIQLTAQAQPGAPATLKDISNNGLCCTYGEPVREMTVVKLDMRFPGQKDMHSVQGVVVRCAKRRGESPPTYEIAIYFAEMAAASRAALEQYVGATLTRTVGAK